MKQLGLFTITDHGSANSFLDIIQGKDSGQFTSPGYPSNYPNNVNYTWLIQTGHKEAKVTITIHDMDINDWGNCEDYLKVNGIELIIHKYHCTPLTQLQLYLFILG
jgi:hypothetical protein